ncbi:hypothetical protein ABFS82_10G161600 [Erythranthe guttata]|uniref:Glycosyltransferase n=1 Tax=Erythranthe guttata TaxID=4155 RepID=A0A022PV73_ERYGU|nr:hypothetical protein MIMGU_mgv1a019962mg [Erythranthe guttata]
MENQTNNPSAAAAAAAAAAIDNTTEKAQVTVIIVPFPAQGHLNQMLQLSCLISSYSIPVHYVGSAVHNRQAQLRSNGLNPNDVAGINFHDLPIPPFASPPPDPNSANKFPAQLQPAFDATLNLRQPLADFMRTMSEKHRRVVVIHDPLIASVVEDIVSIPNAESYAFNCISAFCDVKYLFEMMGKPCPVPRLQELPTIEECITDGVLRFIALQNEGLQLRNGDLHNTCRLLEDPYLDILESEEIAGGRKSWAIGPLIPAKLPEKTDGRRHDCLTWLDKQEPKSVMYVTFGTTTTLTDEEIEVVANGLEQSKHKFLWVLREADKGNVFDGEERREIQLPSGFERRVDGVGMVFREWAPQPEILAHESVGGFMSHCGWNSCIESITMGVPIATWPMHSDQPTNAVLVTEILRTGLCVKEWTKEREMVVIASTVESIVRRLMGSEEGAEVRKRAEDLAAVVRRATEEGGASRLELDSFVAHITRQNE